MNLIIRYVYKIFIVSVLITVTGVLFPEKWWTGVITVFAAGLYFQKRWESSSPFLIAFTAGFACWFFTGLYYHLAGNGLILNRFGAAFGMGYLSVLGLTGLCGGLFSWLALSAGLGMRNFITSGNSQSN